MSIAWSRPQNMHMGGGHSMRSDIVPGGSFPDYALPDHTGAIRKLSELQGRDPMILTLTRGYYWPKERSLVLNPHRTSARRMLTSPGRLLTSGQHGRSRSRQRPGHPPVDGM
jgi:hypothetical protein